MLELQDDFMALIEEFEKSGTWLFRWRSYLPIALLGFFLLALQEYKYPGHDQYLEHFWEISCFIVIFLGLGIRIFTIGHAPRGTSDRNTKKQVAESLNTTGMYSIVRNPLYLGNYFAGLGVALLTHLWWLAVIYTLAHWLYYERIIFTEEAYLRKKFANKYMQWSNKTPVFIPKLRQYRKANIAFSLRNVLKREYSGFFAIIVAMFIVKTFREISSESKLDFDLGWVSLLGVGFIVWLTLRMTKKYTSLFDVKGR